MYGVNSEGYCFILGMVLGWCRQSGMGGLMTRLALMVDLNLRVNCVTLIVEGRTGVMGRSIVLVVLLVAVLLLRLLTLCILGFASRCGV